MLWMGPLQGGDNGRKTGLLTTRPILPLTGENMRPNDKIEMADVTVDVIIDRKVAYGTVGSTPFRARMGNTSPYLGGGKSIWEVNDEFSTVQKRIIARAIWRAMDEEGNVRVSKQWRIKDNWGFSLLQTVTADFPGRKQPVKRTLYKGKK